MNPSDTHIERMAETFAERHPFQEGSKDDRKQTWKQALEIGRDDGVLTQIESHMRAKGVVDAVADDAWKRAREYPDYDEAPTEIE